MKIFLNKQRVKNTPHVSYLYEIQLGRYKKDFSIWLSISEWHESKLYSFQLPFCSFWCSRMGVILIIQIIQNQQSIVKAFNVPIYVTDSSKISTWKPPDEVMYYKTIKFICRHMMIICQTTSRRIKLSRRQSLLPRRFVS